ncbi:MAG: mevalonate kinase [Thermoanaerobaculia bacterium]
MPALATEASAPGKLILMGEHAAVYGVPAVTASVGLRTAARVAPRPIGSSVALELTDLGLREELSWDGVLEYGERRRALWTEYQAAPSPERFSALRAGEEAGVVKIAMAETLRFLEREPAEAHREPLRLSVRSELPMGSGFGSSASVAVAVVAALVASLTSESAPDPSTVAEVVLEAEKRQHGQPSGVDHTTVLRGGFLFLTREDEGLKIERLSRPSWFLPGVRVFDSGPPDQATGEVVAAVRELESRDSEAFATLLSRMEGAVREFAAALACSEPAWPAVLGSVKAFERSLEALGVVPEPARDAIVRIEAAGGAAKISGAGALSGRGAGSLIVFWPPGADGDPRRILADYRPLDADLGSPGLEVRRHKESESAGA